jgi:RHS repeat-associated protein
LYYLQSRYYSPELCRFISADDTSILLATQGELLGANLFAYCANNPVMNSDPSGHITLTDILSIKDAYKQAKTIAQLSSTFRNILYRYTLDVLNYSYDTNWVIKHYTVSYKWVLFIRYEVTNIYTNAQLQRIRQARDTIWINLVGKSMFKHFTNIDPSLEDWRKGLWGNKFAEWQIREMSLMMIIWDSKTFAEIYNGTGVFARL